MFQWLLNKLESNGRKLVIYDREGEEPYLTRYYLRHPDGEHRAKKDIPYNIFLHQFMRSDEPVFHSHPWDWYFTLILKGGYWAHTPWGTKWMGPGSMQYVNCRKMRYMKYGRIHYVRLPANLHWVEIPKPGKTWTLFIRGKSISDWGFCPNPESGLIINQSEYLEKRVKHDNTILG